MTARFALPAVAAGLVLAAGCGRPEFARLEVVPAGGQVLYKGKPPEGAEVTLLPVNDPSPDAVKPRGKVGKDGTYRLATYPSADGRPDGAPPGEYRVSVRWAGRKAGSAAGSAVAPDGPPGPAGLQPDKLGERYSDPARSGLVVTVGAGQPIPTINLK